MKLYASSGLGQDVKDKLVELSGMTREAWIKHKSWLAHTMHMVDYHTHYRVEMQ